MIPPPSKPRIIFENGSRAAIEIDGLYPGYGATLGNSLRRTLLSSLKGAVITAVKIEGVQHEFSTLDGVMEDVVDLILNLKGLRFRLYEEGPFTITLSVNGEREVTGKDFIVPSQVELMNKEAYIATLTSKKAKLHMEATVESGVGYVPVEARSKEKVEIGTIFLDAAFSPVRHINYEVENMRVGGRTDFNRLKLDIDTDGSVTPREAFQYAVEILVSQLGALAQGFIEAVSGAKEREGAVLQVGEALSEAGVKEETAALKIKLEDLKLSSRTLNALREGGVKTVGGLIRRREETLREMEGLGDKGIQEIKKALGNLGITLKQ